MRKQRIFDPRVIARIELQEDDCETEDSLLANSSSHETLASDYYDGPDDDAIINDEPNDYIPDDDLPWLGDNPADDYIMTNREIRGEL